MTAEQVDDRTPDQWLLDEFDANRYERHTGNYVRRLCEVIDDHPADECIPYASNAEVCRHLSGQARWPKPWPGHDLGESVDTLHVAHQEHAHRSPPDIGSRSHP